MSLRDVSVAPADVTGSSLTPSDDFVHEPTTGVQRWTENIQWNMFDTSGLGVIWHIGTMLRDPELWHIVVVVRLPDGTVLAGKQVAPGVGDFGSPSAHLTTIEPFARWRFRFHGGLQPIEVADRAGGLVPDDNHTPATVELELEAAYPVWIPSGSDTHVEWGRFHHEQPVRGRGLVTVDGSSFEFDGIGHRDHSIGPRDMSDLRRAFWGNGIFTSGWAFATMQGEYADSEFQRAAVFDGQDFVEVTMHDWTLLGDATGAPFDVAVRLEAPGWSRRITGRVVGGMNFTVADGAEFCMGTDVGTPSRYVLTNMFVNWESDGEVGVGYLDRGALIALLR